MTCVAPQTRKYWMEHLAAKTDDHLNSAWHSADHGFRQWRNESPRHRHDWTIYRACCIREFRRRGLDPPLRT